MHEMAFLFVPLMQAQASHSKNKSNHVRLSCLSHRAENRRWRGEANAIAAKSWLLSATTNITFIFAIALVTLLVEISGAVWQA